MKYFCVYYDLYESLEALTLEERGRLFTACCQYSRGEDVIELVGNERILFPMLKAQILRDRAKYDERCEKNRVTAVKREAEKRKRGDDDKATATDCYEETAEVHKQAQLCTIVHERHQEKEEYKEKEEEKYKYKYKDKEEEKEKEKEKATPERHIIADNILRYDRATHNHPKGENSAINENDTSSPHDNLKKKNADGIWAIIEQMNEVAASKPKSASADSEAFDTFWAEYPRPVDKKYAKVAWEKIAPDEALAKKIVEGVILAKKFDKRFSEGIIPNPENYLNDRKWEKVYPEQPAYNATH